MDDGAARGEVVGSAACGGGYDKAVSDGVCQMPTGERNGDMG